MAEKPTYQELERRIKQLEQAESERKQVEKGVETSEKRFRELFQNNPACCFTFNRKGVIQNWNRACETLYGWTPEQAIGKSMFDLFVQQKNVARTKKNIKALFGGESFEAVEFEDLRADGSLCSVLASGYPFKDSNEQVIYGLCAELDITERRQAKKLMQESEAKFRALVESSSDWIWEVNVEGVYTYVSPQIEAISGYKPEEIIGKTPFDLMPSSEAERVEVIFNNSVKATAPIIALENTCLHKDGRVVVLETSGVPVFDSAGKFIGYRGMDRDITERKRAEESLREKEHLITSVFESINDGISVLNPDLTIRHVNGVMKEWYSQNLPIEGKKCYKCYRDADKPCTPCPTLRCLESGKTEMNVVPGLPGSNVEWMELYSYPIKYDGTESITGVVEFVRDITKSMQVQKALQESEKKYRRLAEECPISIMTFDDEGTVTFVNNWHLKTFSRLKQDAGFFIGKKITELPGIVKAGVATELGTVLHGKHVDLADVHFPEFTGGHAGYQNIKAVPIYREEGLVGGILIREDVTKRKHAEDNLRESEEKYRSMMDAMNDPAYICSMDFCVEYMNPAMINRTGRDATGESCFKVLHNLKEKCPWCMQDRAQRGELFEQKILSPKDNRVYQIAYSPIVHIDGSISTLAVFRDVTKLEQAKEVALESEKRFRNLFESITDLIYTQDLDGKITSANPAMSKLFGYGVGEFLGRRASDFMKPELRTHFEDEYLPEVKRKGYYEGISSYFKKDGSKIYIEYRSTIVNPDNGNSFISGIGKDITEKVLSKREVEKLQGQLSQAQKMESIGTLAGGIAHDFNNILHAINGYSELAMEEVAQNSRGKKYLNQVLKATMRATDMVQQILTFSRKVETKKKPIRVQSVIKEALKLLRPIIPSTIEIRQSIVKNCGPVLADPTQIHQVIMNLSTNAYQAMREKGGLMELSLTEEKVDSDDSYTELHPGTYIKFTLSDSGHGMDDVVVKKIFDPYFSTKNLGEGTGMGLSVVHGIVKDHGGSIEVYSELGEGSTFHVYLPLIDSKTVDPKTLSSKPTQTGTEHILFVDDEKEIVYMAQKILNRLGYEVTSCRSSVEALEAFKAKPNGYDLVITDMTMPSMTGDALAIMLKQIRRDIPIIICTGFSDRINENSAKAIGVSKIITKPISKNEFATAIRKALD